MADPLALARHRRMYVYRPTKPVLRACIIRSWFCLFLLCLVSCGEPERDQAFENAFRKADSMYVLNQKDESVKFIDSFFAARNDMSPKWLFEKYRFLKGYHYYNADYARSKAYVDSMLYALEQYRKKDAWFYTKYTLALNDKGDVHYSENNLNKAFEYYYQSRLAALNSGDTCALGNHSYHLGMVTYRQAKYQDAISYFRQSFVENARCGNDSINFFRSQELLNNIALCYTKMKMPDSAMQYYGSALDYIREMEGNYGPYARIFTERARGVIYGNQAKIHSVLGRPDSAELLLERSIAINKRPGYDSLDAQFAQIQLGELYYNQGRSPDAILRDLRASLDTLVNQEVELRWRRLMYMHLERTGKPSSALEYMYSYIRLNDSMEAANIYRNTDVSRLLQFQEAQSRMTLLRKDNQLRRLYLWMAGGFSIMAVAIVVLILMNYRKSRRNVQQLRALNGKINGQNHQLEETLSALENSNREKDRIMRVVAHDLRGPISGVAFLTDRILRNEELDTEEKQSLSLIKDISFNSMNLINELLEQNSSADENKELVNLGDLVRLSATMLQFKASEKQQSLDFREEYGLLQVHVNPGRILRVLNNIISNATKFSGPGTRIRIRMLRRQEMAVVSIEDQGIGISDELRPHILEMIPAARRTGTSGERSYGLGLSIARQIVEGNGGQLWFETEEGKGSVFYFSLPLHDQS